MMTTDLHVWIIMIILQWRSCNLCREFKTFSPTWLVYTCVGTLQRALWPLTNVVGNWRCTTLTVHIPSSTTGHLTRCLPSIVYSPQSATHRQPSVVYHQRSAIHRLPSAVYRPPSTTHGLQAIIYHLTSTVCRLPFTIYHSPYHPPSTVHGLLSTIRPPSTVHPPPTTIYHLAASIYCLKFKNKGKHKFSKFVISKIRSRMNILYL